MTDQELIEWLRQWRVNYLNISADRIEELNLHADEAYDKLANCKEELKSLRDQLAKAIEALRNILSGDDMYPWRIAREVLVELEAKE